MVDPITAVAGAILLIDLLIYAAYVVFVVWLCIAALVGLLNEWANQNSVSENDVGFITQDISSGNCTHIQGVWNTRSKTVRGAWKIKAENVDSDIRSKFKNADVILIS